MKIICVARNYPMHAKELNNPTPPHPVIFLKPDSAILPTKRPFFIPEFDSNIHHEIELVVRVNKLGRHIQEKFAHRYYDEVTVGIDFTARTTQQELAAKGLPWEIAKGFDGSAVLGKFINKAEVDVQNAKMNLEINGSSVQKGSTADMLFSVDQLIAYISQFFTLKIGDLIFTGTPAGVGPVTPNDELIGYLNGQPLLRCQVR